MAQRDYLAEFEDFKAAILANGGTIKDENGLRAQFNFRKGVISDAVFKRFVDGERPKPKKQEAASEIKTEKTIEKEEKAAPEKENKEEQPAPKKKTQKERFEDYKAKLAGKGIIINNEEAVFEIFRKSQRGVDYDLIREFVTFPERQKDKPKKKVIKLKPRVEDNTNKPTENETPQKVEDNKKTAEIIQKSENKKSEKNNKKEDSPTPSLSPFEEYMADIRNQGYTISDIRTLLKTFKEHGSVAPENLAGIVTKEEKIDKPRRFLNVKEAQFPVPVTNEKNLPAVIENKWADSWIQPLQDWCDTDKDSKGAPKRSLTTIKADDKSAVVEIKPSADFAKENPNDKGANYSFQKTDKEDVVDVTLSNPEGNPLHYEYFRHLMETAKKNGVGIIAFDENIKTDEFRDKLLAAALEYGMQLKNAPVKINYNAPYLKDLPSAVKIKLGIHNGDLTAKGEPVNEVLDRLKERRDKVLGREEKPEDKKENTDVDNMESKENNPDDDRRSDDRRSRDDRDRERRPRYNDRENNRDNRPRDRDDTRERKPYRDRENNGERRTHDNNGERRERRSYRDRDDNRERRPRDNQNDGGDRRPRDNRNQGDRPAFKPRPNTRD